MKNGDVASVLRLAIKRGRVGWDRDNSKFVVEEFLPLLKLPKEIWQVIRWAYGYDGSDRSYEQESDGSSVVFDWNNATYRFVRGCLKEMCGVGHDYLNRVENHTTPDGHVWKAWETNTWYSLCMKYFAYCWVQRQFRRVALNVSVPFWWA